MSAKTDKLLSQYRIYENLVRDSGQDPKDVEDGMAEADAARMRMIRQFRNFLSHQEAPGFLEPTDKMLAFLDAQVKDWAMRGDVARKHLRTPAASVCDEAETCAEGIAKLAKLKRTKLVVRDKAGGYGLCEIYALASLVASSKSVKLRVAPRLKERPVFVAPDVPVEKIDRDRVNICTADGTASGKLLGVVDL